MAMVPAAKSGAMSQQEGKGEAVASEKGGMPAMVAVAAAGPNRGSGYHERRDRR